MKSAIVLNENLGPGFLSNAAACIATGLFKDQDEAYGNQINNEFISFIPITKIPILIFKQDQKTFKELLKRAKRNKLKYMLFTKEAQSTTSYQEYITRVQDKELNELETIGIGVIGDEDAINKFSGDLALLR